MCFIIKNDKLLINLRSKYTEIVCKTSSILFLYRSIKLKLKDMTSYFYFFNKEVL